MIAQQINSAERKKPHQLIAALWHKKGVHVISDEAKKTIDALSMEEILYEVMTEDSSRFQGEEHDYLLARFALIKKGKSS